MNSYFAYLRAASSVRFSGSRYSWGKMSRSTPTLNHIYIQRPEVKHLTEILQENKNLKCRFESYFLINSSFTNMNDSTFLFVIFCKYIQVLTTEKKHIDKKITKTTSKIGLTDLNFLTDNVLRNTLMLSLRMCCFT